MNNRAKCKLCGDIIESVHPTDNVSCKCDEISVMGGDALYCFAKDWKNFVRVDDEGNEVEVKVQPKENPTKKELLGMLDSMYQNIEDLPIEAAIAPVTHADLASLIMLLSAILREE